MTGKRRRLAERRKVVGYAQEPLAAVLGVERSTVQRWEAGETTPQPWLRPKLAEVLGVSLDELDAMLAEGQTGDDGRSTSSEPLGSGELLHMDAAEELPDDPEHDPVLVAPWNHRGTVEAAAALRGGDQRVKRRVILSLPGAALTAPAHQWLVHEPEPLVSGLAGQRVSATLVDRFPAMIAELRAMDDVAGGGDVLALTHYHFDWVAGLLDRASYDEATGRNLHGALAELGNLAGWVCYDTGQHGLAQRYNIAALRAAHSADDRQLGAHILSEMAYQAAHQGRPAEAVTFTETALAGTRGQQTPRLRAELYIHQAHAFAAVKDASACTAAISQARSHVDHGATDNDPPYLYWVRPAEITTSAGECLLRLGQADRAAAMLDQGIALFDVRFGRDRQYYLTHLAEALARPGKQRDLEAAAAHGIAAIDLSEGLSSTLNVDRIRDLVGRMKPHAKLPAVAEFLERAQGLVAV